MKRRADPYHDTEVIDARAPRVNQAVVGIVSLVAVLTGWWVLLALLALQLALGLVLGRRWCLACVFYYEVLQPRFGEGPLEDSRPPRFANVIGFAFLAAASVAYPIGLDDGRRRARRHRGRPGAARGGDGLLHRLQRLQARLRAHRAPVRLVPAPAARRPTSTLVLCEPPVEDDAPAVRVGDRDAAAVPVRVLRLHRGVAERVEACRHELRLALRFEVEDEQVVRRSAPVRGCRRRGR